MRSPIPIPSSFRALAKRRFRALPPSMSTFLKSTFWTVVSRMRGDTPCVRDAHPLVGPAKGDGGLELGAIARVGDGVFHVDGEHPASGELLILSVLGGGEAPEDGGDHFVMILEGIVVAPRWSVASGSIVVVVVWLLSLELLSQAEAVLHLVLAVLMEGA